MRLANGECWALAIAKGLPLPDVNHTRAIHEQPSQYEQRVVGFFDRALLAK